MPPERTNRRSRATTPNLSLNHVDIPPRDVYTGVFRNGRSINYKMTAGSNGSLGAAEQNRSIARANAEAPPSPANTTNRVDLRPSADVQHNEALLPHRAKLFFFRNMTIIPQDLRFLYSEPNIENTRGWEFVKHNIEKWRVSLQRQLWGTPWFREYVRTQVILYNKSQRPNDSGYGEDTPYDSMTSQEQANFWKDPSRFSYANISKIIKPLKQAVVISAVWNDARWNDYLRNMFHMACHSAWNFRGRWEDGAHADNIKRLQPQIYQDIRDAPQLLALDRPPVEDIPLAAGAPVMAPPRPPAAPTVRRHGVQRNIVGNDFDTSNDS